MQTNMLRNAGIVNYAVSAAEEAFLDAFHMNEIELLNLTGGIPAGSLYNMLLQAEYDSTGGVMYLSSESDHFTAERKWFHRYQFIYNASLKVFSTGEGLGTSILINEIVQARRLGIQWMRVSAARTAAMNGYYTWARLGYSIDSETDDQETFNDLMRQHGRSEANMIALMAAGDGKDFWFKYGFWWQGIFDVAAGSDNIKALNSYLASKGIAISL